MRLVLALALSVVLSHPARACSVCGCDPSSATLGLERPARGDLRFSIEDRYLQKESGTVVDGTREGEREDRLDLRIQYSLPRLSFQVEVPVYAFKSHQGLDGAVDDTSRGLGDLGLGARYELMKEAGDARHVLALTASLKAPTGNNAHLAPVDDGTYDEHKQLGTGTWDQLYGAYYTFVELPWTAYAGLSARVNGTNGRGNHFGNALFGTLGVRRAFLDNLLQLSLDAQARNAGTDTVPGGVYDRNSGGLLTYTVASAGYFVTNQLLVRATLQVPVIAALNGAQSEHPVAFLSLAYDVAL